MIIPNHLTCSPPNREAWCYFAGSLVAAQEKHVDAGIAKLKVPLIRELDYLLSSLIVQIIGLTAGLSQLNLIL